MLLSSDLGCRSRQGSVRVGKVESSLQALGDSGSPTVRITSRPTPGYHKVSQCLAFSNVLCYSHGICAVNVTVLQAFFNYAQAVLE
eukprot:s2640_g17.t1